MTPPHGTKAIEKAFDLLDLVADHPSGLPLHEISRISHMPKSTAHRILAVLVRREMLRFDPANDQYKIGRRPVLLSRGYLAGFNFAQEIRPVLEELNRSLDETIHLGVLDATGQRVVYIDKLDSSRAVRMFSRVGQTVPVHCTALGKAILSALSADALATVLKDYRFKIFTPNTIPNRARLLAEIRRVRERGYAVDDHEHEGAVMCVGKAFRNSEGEVLGAISVSIPELRVKEDTVRRLAQHVIRGVAHIEEIMHHIPSTEVWG